MGSKHLVTTFSSVKLADDCFYLRTIPIIYTKNIFLTNTIGNVSVALASLSFTLSHLFVRPFGHSHFSLFDTVYIEYNNNNKNPQSKSQRSKTQMRTQNRDDKTLKFPNWKWTIAQNKETVDIFRFAVPKTYCYGKKENKMQPILVWANMTKMSNCTFNCGTQPHSTTAVYCVNRYSSVLPAHWRKHKALSTTLTASCTSAALCSLIRQSIWILKIWCIFEKNINRQKRLCSKLHGNLIHYWYNRWRSHWFVVKSNIWIVRSQTDFVHLLKFNEFWRFFQLNPTEKLDNYFKNKDLVYFHSDFHLFWPVCLKLWVSCVLVSRHRRHSIVGDADLVNTCCHFISNC